MLKIGFIGAGRMGNAHAENLAKLAHVQITGVYDINPEKSRAFREKYPSAQIFSSAEAVAGSAETDLVMIASPTPFHPEGIRAAIAANKAIFCEKPLCRTQEQLNETAPLILRYPNFFTIGFVRRYAASVVMMRKMLEEGQLGRILCASLECRFGGFARNWDDWFTDYSMSGGVQLDMLTHQCDLLNAMLGVPKTIYAKSLRLDKNLLKPCDYVSATAEYPCGVIANFECSWLRSGPSGTNTVIYGDKGTLKLSDDDGLIHYLPGREGVKINVDEGITAPLQDVISGGMYAVEMAVLVDSVLNGKPARAGAKEAVDAMRVSLAMMRSSETGTVQEI